MAQQQQFTATPTAPRPIPQISDKIPMYKLLKPYFDKNDAFCEEGDYIKLRGEPNEFMEPLNDLAEKEMRKYLGKLDQMAAGVLETKKPVSKLEKYEQERVLKNNTVDNSDEEEGLVGVGTFTVEAKKAILGARKIKIGEDEYTIDKRVADKKVQDKTAKKAEKINDMF